MRFKKIVVPTDFSAASKAAFEPARELAEEHDGEVVLVHVMELPHYPTLFEGTALVVPPIDESLRGQLEAQLAKIVKEEFEDRGRPARAALREGSPTSELCQFFEEEKPDLVVIATHGYTGLKHALLGSTTEQIVRHATCPVMTIRAPRA